MKFRKDKDILRFLGMSLGMVFLGVIISLLNQPINIIGGGLILGGLVLLVTGLYVSTKPKEYFISDERVKPAQGIKSRFHVLLRINNCLIRPVILQVREGG